MILRPLIDRIIELRALPEPSDGEYKISWAALSDPGERERADTAEVLSRAAVNFQTAKNILTPDEGRELLGLEGPAPDVEDDTTEAVDVEPEPEPDRQGDDDEIDDPA